MLTPVRGDTFKWHFETS